MVLDSDNELSGSFKLLVVVRNIDLFQSILTKRPSLTTILNVDTHFFCKNVDFQVQPQSFLKNPKLRLENILIFQLLKMGLKQLNLTKKGSKWSRSCRIFLNETDKVS